MAIIKVPLAITEMEAGMAEAGGGGGTRYINQRRHIMLTTFLLATPDFQAFRHPCNEVLEYVE